MTLMSGSETMTHKQFWHFNQNNIDPEIVKRHHEEVDELKECLAQLHDLWIEWAFKIEGLSVEELDSLQEVKEETGSILYDLDIYE